MALLMTVLSACATLPNVDKQMAATTPADVVIVDAKGRPDARKGDALLARLEQRSGSSDILQKHLAFEQQANPAHPLVLGNRVSLLQNGPQTYEAMFQAIANAKSHINLETFVFDDGDVGEKFSRLLRERAQQGLRVNVIYDSVGTIMIPRTFFETMRSSGVRMLEFNPVSPTARRPRPWRLNNRDHRKLLIIDGTTAFVGGINISDTYSSSPSGSDPDSEPPASADGQHLPEQGWRDTHLRIEGPVVAQFQRLYVQTWVRQGATPLDETGFFPAIKPQGDAVVRAISSTYQDKDSPIFATLLSAIQHAESYVHLTVAYFAPDRQLMDALEDAAQRGVDVRLILPNKTDSWAVFHVGRSHYAELLKAGVKIHERQGPVMHSKTASIDGVWSTIGSTNLDWRSFLHNDEVNAVVLNIDFAKQMQTMFVADLSASEEIDLDRWRRRSLLLRIQEMTARLGAYVL